MVDVEALEAAVEAEGSEQVECPFCGEEIPAFELESDHAHAREQSELLLAFLKENKDA